MNAGHIFAVTVTGVMNIKQIMKFVFAIDVMLFIAGLAMRWINVMIVARLFVERAQHYCPANSVAVDSAKNAQRRVEGR